MTALKVKFRKVEKKALELAKQLGDGVFPIRACLDEPLTISTGSTCEVRTGWEVTPPPGYVLEADSITTLMVRGVNVERVTPKSVYLSNLGRGPVNLHDRDTFAFLTLRKVEEFEVEVVEDPK